MTARLYTGAALMIAAMIVRAAWMGSWSTVLVAVIGLLLIVASFSPEGEQG